MAQVTHVTPHTYLQESTMRRILVIAAVAVVGTFGATSASASLVKADNKLHVNNVRVCNSHCLVDDVEINVLP
jgi:hypothetical protein